MTENAEIVRRMFDAWNRRDLDAGLELADPEIEYVNPPSAVEPGTRHGHEGFATVARKQWEGLGDARFELERIHEPEEGEVYTVGRTVRPMSGSDSTIMAKALIKWTIRDGKVTRMEILGVGSDFPEAMAAAGLD